MSFGFSVGDFITVLELGNKIRREFAGAPTQFRHLSDENLTIVIQDIDVLIAGTDLNAQQIADLKELADSCRNILTDLDNTINKYKELQTSGGNAGMRIKRVWKRLKWEPEDISELRMRITSNTTLLHAYIGRISSATTMETKKALDRIDQRQDNQERLAILDWLSPIDYASEQTDSIRRRQPGTGQWLLESLEFQTWLNSLDQKSLFCPGIPGAGKTILTAIVIDELTTRFQDDDTVGIAYIYCNFRRHDDQTAEGLLLSLVKELAQRRSVPPASVKSLFDKHKDNRTRPSFHEISKTLRSIISLCSKVWIVIDALDECSCLPRFLDEVLDLKTLFGTKLFATSRFIPDIVEKFRDSLSLEIRATPEDIYKFVDGYISQLPSFVARNPMLQEEVKDGIVQAVDGMFLLAQLNLQSLVGKRSTKALRTCLGKLPTGSEAYVQAYEDCMERIESQVEDQTNLAKQVLSWITCAKRPLTTLELQHALAVELGSSDIDQDNIPDIEDMLSVCAGLVTVDAESEVIRLVHFTTQQYFELNQTRWFSTIEDDITQVCLAYLSYSAFDAGPCQTWSEFRQRLDLFPFYDYAARHWGYHARESANCQQKIGQQTLTDFLETESKLHASSQVLLADRPDVIWSIPEQDLPMHSTALHVAVFFELEAAFNLLLPNKFPPDVRDPKGQTALSWAAEMGSCVGAGYLLATGDVDVNSRQPKYGLTPLILAAAHDHIDVIELLLSYGADMEVTDSHFNSTPILWAAWRGHREVVMLLAERGAELEPRNCYGSTPLSLAVEFGYLDVVRLLLERGANVNLFDDHDQSPLSHAAENGYESIVEMLLKVNKVDVEAGDGCGQTPLLYAIQEGYPAIVKMLLETGAVKWKTETLMEPFILAVSEGREAIVKLFVSLDDDGIEWEDHSLDNLVSIAREKGHKIIVRQLMMFKSRMDVDDGNRGPSNLTHATRNSEGIPFQESLSSPAKVTYSQIQSLV